MSIDDLNGRVVLNRPTSEHSPPDLSVRGQGDDAMLHPVTSTPQNAQPSDAPAAESSSSLQPEENEFRVADIKSKTGWASFYMQYGLVTKGLDKERIQYQYGVIEYSGRDGKSDPVNLGVFVSYNLCDHLGISVDLEDVNKFSSSEIMEKNTEVREILGDRKPVVILRYGKPKTLIFPVDAIPESLIQHIKQFLKRLPTQEAGEGITHSKKQDAAVPDQRDVKSHGTVDMRSYLASFNTLTFRWGDIRGYSASVTKAISNGQGHAVIKKNSEIIGLAVSNRILSQSGQSETRKAMYTPAEIGTYTKEAIGFLKNGTPIAITRYNLTQLTIYPIQSVPDVIASHVLGIDPKKNGDDVIASGQQISVPEDLLQRKGEDVILARIEEVKRILGDKDVIAEIRWNEVTLRMITNSILIDNAHALAEYFNLRTQDVQPDDATGNNNVSWVHAFEEASSQDGLIILRPTAEQQTVLMTKDPDFFANFARVFCENLKFSRHQGNFYMFEESDTVILKKYEPMVLRIAYQWIAKLPANVELDDLIQEGSIALLDAKQRYDLQFGTTFETFATHRINGAILDHLRGTDWAPRSVRRKYREIDKARALIENRNGRKATPPEISAELGISLEEYHQIMISVTGASVTSLDEESENGDDTYISQELADPNLVNPLDIHLEDELKDLIRQAAENLPERERFVITSVVEHDLGSGLIKSTI